MDINDTIEDLDALAGAVCDSKANRNVNWYMWAEKSNKPGCVVMIGFAEDVVFVPAAWTEMHFASASDAKAWLAKALLSDCAKELGVYTDELPQGLLRADSAQNIVPQFDDYARIDGLSDLTTARMGKALFEVANAEFFQLQEHQ